MEDMVNTEGKKYRALSAVYVELLSVSKVSLKATFGDSDIGSIIPRTEMIRKGAMISFLHYLMRNRLLYESEDR